MAYDAQGKWIYDNPANVPGSGNASPSSAAYLSSMLAGAGAVNPSGTANPSGAIAPGDPGNTGYSGGVLPDPSQLKGATSAPPTGVAAPGKAPTATPFGGGWDQYATDPKSMAYGLKTALGQGLKGDDALGWMQNNGWAGAVNTNGSGIQAYGDGSFGLPGGLKVVNGANGPDIYEGGSKSGSSFGSQGSMFPSSLLTSMPTAGVDQGAAGGTPNPTSPNTSGADTAASIAAAQAGGNTQLAQLLAQLMGGGSGPGNAASTPNPSHT